MYGYIIKALLNALFFMFLVGCDQHPWNSPNPFGEYQQNIRFSSFNDSPKTLDPAQSYSTNETLFVAQIYEPPVQYQYLKRPYTLEPLTAQKMPVLRTWNTEQEALSAPAPNLTPTTIPTENVAYSTYDITIKPGIFYQPHPAFAKDKNGNFLYHSLTPKQLHDIQKLSDFPQSGTRELTAEDYVYEIKRLAEPWVNSPILGLMSTHILGLEEYAQQLQKRYRENPNVTYIDLREVPFVGAKVINKYTYRIILKGEYKQFIYWLSMTFFAPIPWEADVFYSQPGLRNKNITFDWYPIGTGAYFLAENNPNKQMVLARNPNFHSESFPTEGEASDKAAGYLEQAGKRLPFVDKYIFSLEKESIPRWNKFLQGYYDQSIISSDNFGEAVQVNAKGTPYLTKKMLQENIRLRTSVEPSIYYYGFNMLDETIGGNSERARKLRQAISIAINQEEFITIFLNGRGVAAQGPIPAGIFGHLNGAAGINPYVYDNVNGFAQRKSIAAAKKILAAAGYPEGRDAHSGKPLVLRYDATSTSAGDKDQFDWLRKQFKQLGIELNIESTDYNRLQEKLRHGDAQIFSLAWVADYPDPENFLFLFYSKNGQVKYDGMNTSNYANPIYDQLFESMKNMANDAERQKIIQQMLEILRKDSPWVWGVNPKEFVLSHAWVGPTKPNPITYNILKYQTVDPVLRYHSIIKWNRPILWPIGVFFLLLLCIIVPVFIWYWRKIHHKKIS